MTTEARSRPTGDSGVLSWLEGRASLGIKPGLTRVRALLDHARHPQDAYRSVHVAGTNGKGSVATFIANALTWSGHRTGVFTSPALGDVTETIMIDGEAITHSELAGALERVRPAAERLDREGDPPSYFEILTVAALAWFREAGAGCAVVEAGMGGRLDSTNVLRPSLSVITNVTLDHTAHLGEDIATIATEKAGIIQEDVPVVTAANGEALQVLKDVCRRKRAPLIVVGADYRVFPAFSGIRLDTGSGSREYHLAARGAHQHENAALVVAACDTLRLSGLEVAESAVERALRETTMPGRIEVIDIGAKRVILDGAHNPAAARCLRGYLDSLGSRFHLVVGFSRDKDWPAILAEWLPVAGRVTAVGTSHERSLEPGLVSPHVPEATPFDVATDFEVAWRSVLESDIPDVVIAGSLFLVGEARRHLLAAADGEQAN